MFFSQYNQDYVLERKRYNKSNFTGIYKGKYLNNYPWTEKIMEEIQLVQKSNKINDKYERNL